MSGLPPPPPPRKISSMPPGAPPPPGALPPRSMMSMPTMAGPMGCPPSIGGMGPNLCFNFYQPYGTPCVLGPPPSPCGGGGDEPPEEPKPPIYVQGRRTWRLPRMTTEEGKPLKSEPCTIM